MKGLGKIKRTVRQIESISQKFLLSFPKRVECNGCNWHGRHFISDSWHEHIICPSCRSQVRHRLLLAALSWIEPVSYEKIVRDKCVIHFAPQQAVKGKVKKLAKSYITADLFKDDVDINLDIANMVDVPNNTFDLLIACDVLEHVNDDKKALGEINRVLCAGGYAILTVPQQDGLEKTIEDVTIATPQERKRIFGHPGHVRIYGNDFVNRLQQTGFEIIVVNEASFEDDLVKKHVLSPPTLSEKSFATNYRKVFFAQKVLSQA